MVLQKCGSKLECGSKLDEANIQIYKYRIIYRCGGLLDCEGPPSFSVASLNMKQIEATISLFSTLNAILSEAKS